MAFRDGSDDPEAEAGALIIADFMLHVRAYIVAQAKVRSRG